MADNEEDLTLTEALREFHEQSGDGAFANLFLLARQRAGADEIDIVDAIMAELRLRLRQTQ